MSTTSTDARQRLDDRRSDFNEFLHELRTQALEEVPDAGPVFLSAGCSGRWYFDWIRETYSGAIESHIGVEAFSPKPSDLPDEAVWIDNTLDAMSDVGDASVDVVFAGQVVEHLWPDVLAGFLTEAHRVLRPGGLLVVDSPERSITELVGWTQPEHTIELTVAEAQELLTLAGFVDLEVRGLWLCRDPETGAPMGLEPVDSDWERRVDEAGSNPQHSFVWWIECRRGPGDPDVDSLRTRCHALWWDVWPRVMGRIHTQGRHVRRHDGDHLHVPAGAPAYPLFGPYAPLAPGSWTVEFVVASEGLDPQVPDADTVFEVDAVHGAEDSTLGRRAVTAGEVRAANGAALVVELPFTTADTVFSWQRRVLSHGNSALTVHAHLTRVRPAAPRLDRAGSADHGAAPAVGDARTSIGTRVGTKVGALTDGAVRTARRGVRSARSVLRREA